MTAVPDPLTAPLPPRVVAAMRQCEAALDCLNHAARQLGVFDVLEDYPTACEHLRTAQHAAKAAYRALAAGPERSED